MNVLVTGGAGYVGFAIVGTLLENPDVERVVVYDNLSRREYALFTARRSRHDKASFVLGDVLDRRTLARAMDGVDTVIHLAAHVRTPNSDGEAHAFDQVNNWGSGQVATAIEETPSVVRALYMSSVAVYGSSPAPFSTESRPQPSSFYGTTKLRGEKHFERLQRDRAVHIVRAGNVFGYNPAARFDAVINRMAFEAVFGGRLRVEGSGAQTRPFVEVSRLARAAVSLLSSKTPSGIYAFVDRTHSVREVAEAIREAVPSTEVLFVDQDIRMQSVTVEPSPEFAACLPDAPPPLSEQLDALLQALHL